MFIINNTLWVFRSTMVRPTVELYELKIREIPITCPSNIVRKNDEFDEKSHFLAKFQSFSEIKHRQNICREFAKLLI